MLFFFLFFETSKNPRTRPWLILVALILLNILVGLLLIINRYSCGFYIFVLGLILVIIVVEMWFCDIVKIKDEQITLFISVVLALIIFILIGSYIGCAESAYVLELKNLREKEGFYDFVDNYSQLMWLELITNDDYKNVLKSKRCVEWDEIIKRIDDLKQFLKKITKRREYVWGILEKYSSSVTKQYTLKQYCLLIELKWEYGFLKGIKPDINLVSIRELVKEIDYFKNNIRQYPILNFLSKDLEFCRRFLKGESAVFDKFLYRFLNARFGCGQESCEFYKKCYIDVIKQTAPSRSWWLEGRNVDNLEPAELVILCYNIMTFEAIAAYYFIGPLNSGMSSGLFQMIQSYYWYEIKFVE